MPRAPNGVAELSMRLVAGAQDAVIPVFAAAAERGPLPDVDTSLVVDMEAMRQRVESHIDAEVRREVIERSAVLDLDDVFDALEVVTVGVRLAEHLGRIGGVVEGEPA